MADTVDVGSLAKLARQGEGHVGLTSGEVRGVREAQRKVRAGKYASAKKVRSFFARFHARNSQFK